MKPGVRALNSVVTVVVMVVINVTYSAIEFTYPRQSVLLLFRWCLFRAGFPWMAVKRSIRY